MNTLLSVVALFLLLVSSSPATQDFTVLAKRGSVQIQGKPVSLKAKIGGRDTLVVGKDGYVTLAHSNGRVVELAKMGRYPLTTLRASVSKPASSTSQRLLAYVIDELTTIDEAPELSDGHRRKMKATGAVERADGDDVEITDTLAQYGVTVPAVMGYLEVSDLRTDNAQDGIVAVTPLQSRTLQEPCLCAWFAHHSPNAVYTVSVIDASDNVLWQMETTDTTVLIPSTRLPQGALVYWQVSQKGTGHTSEKYSLYRMPEATQQLLDDAKALLAQDVDTTSAVGQLALARLYEEEGMQCYAYTAMLKATLLAPNVPTYRHQLALFYRRNGMIRSLMQLNSTR